MPGSRQSCRKGRSSSWLTRRRYGQARHLLHSCLLNTTQSLRHPVCWQRTIVQPWLHCHHVQVDVPASYLAMSTPACPKMTRDWAFCRWAAAERKVMAIPPTTFYGGAYQVSFKCQNCVARVHLCGSGYRELHVEDTGSCNPGPGVPCAQGYRSKGTDYG